MLRILLSFFNVQQAKTMLISNWNICHYGWCYVYTSMLSPSFNSSNKYLSKHLNSLEVLVLFCSQYTKFGVLYHLARMNLWTLTANYFVEITEYNREWIRESLPFLWKFTQPSFQKVFAIVFNFAISSFASIILSSIYGIS